jgi:HEAT repeats
MTTRTVVYAALAIALVSPPGAALLAQTAPGEIAGHRIRVPGEKVDGTTERLSEVEAEMVARLPPQGQAERLLQYAISHHIGATDEIKQRVKSWRGNIKRSDALATLLEVAINGSDLRVRAAALEIELAAFDVAKTREQVDLLFAQIDASPKDGRHQIWLLGILANRGVEPSRIHHELRSLMRSPDEMVRYQAVAAIASIGTDETVSDLAQAFHRDSSRLVRIDGGGCGLAHCGMLTRAQRMQAVPLLIDMVEDPQLDAETVSYGYRALREITDETLPDDSRQWRTWYAAHGAETTERLRKYEASRLP